LTRRSDAPPEIGRSLDLQAYWEDASLVALAKILEAGENPVGEAADMAGKCADHMAREWRARFLPKVMKAGAAI
jgi:hypothetical protein